MSSELPQLLNFEQLRGQLENERALVLKKEKVTEEDGLVRPLGEAVLVLDALERIQKKMWEFHKLERESEKGGPGYDRKKQAIIHWADHHVCDCLSVDFRIGIPATDDTSETRSQPFGLGIDALFHHDDERQSGCQKADCLCFYGLVYRRRHRDGRGTHYFFRSL